MRNGIIFSAVVHVAAILIAVLGLPLMQKPIEIKESIPIEIVDAGELAGPQVDKTPPAPPRPPQQKPEHAPVPQPPPQVAPAAPPPPPPAGPPGGPAPAGAGAAAPARAT